MKRKMRLAKFGKQTSRGVGIARSLAAGRSLIATRASVWWLTRWKHPWRPSSAALLKNKTSGFPLDEAIEGHGRNRIPNMDLRFFATAVILQRQTGGDLAEILDKIGHLIRERLQISGTDSSFDR